MSEACNFLSFSMHPREIFELNHLFCLNLILERESRRVLEFDSVQLIFNL